MSLSSNRRHFLATASASAAVVGLAQFPGFVIAQAAKAYDFKLGIQLYSLRGYEKTVDVALKHAKDLGFEQVEFYSGMLPLNASSETITAVKKQVTDLGMSISAHGVNTFNGNAEAGRRVFEFAKALGIPNISASTARGVAPTVVMDILNDLVKEFNIRIAIHNHGPGDPYNKVVDVLRVIEGRDERIGACADLGHYIRSGEKPVDVIRALKGRLFGIHLKDFASMAGNAADVILGKGHLNCDEVFAAMKDVGFPANGALSLEYEANKDNPIADIADCVKVAKAALGKA